MKVANAYKFLIALVAIAFGFVIVILCLVGAVDNDLLTPGFALGTNLITGPTWYIIGNGVATKQGIEPQSIIGRKDT